nr:MAG TPA: hypothetical protein [Caudoviricetes sp.]
MEIGLLNTQNSMTHLNVLRHGSRQRLKMSKITDLTKSRIMSLGGILDENIHESDLIRVWFGKDLMTITRNGDLWYLVFKGQITWSPEHELGVAVRFLLNYTITYQNFMRNGNYNDQNAAETSDNK